MPAALASPPRSGPGLSLKTEALGLAITAELPLVVIDVQRAGPSTGMPTKPEQADLEMAVFGRHGESPLPVLAPATPGDCFDIVIDAARIAIEAMTPVIVLSDAYLANAISDWEMPKIEELAAVRATGRTATASIRSPPSPAIRRRSGGNGWLPARRASIHRVGGIEKDSVTGNISYDPDNHEEMVRLRAEKIARVADRNERAMIHEGADEGDLLVVAWGSTYGPVRQAVRNLADAGHDVAHLHLRQLWPLPAGLEAILRRYKNDRVRRDELRASHRRSSARPISCR